MGGEQGAQVGARQHVAVEDQRGVVPQLGRDVGDPAAGAQRLVLDDVVDLQAQLRAVAELRLEDARLVGGAEHDVLDAGRGDPGQQMGQERQPGGRQHRLGRRQRQRPQPGALPADQDDGVHARRVDGIRHASAVLSRSRRLPADHQSRAHRERASHRPPQRRLPPLVVPISQESVGAPVVRGQVAGGVAAGGVTLVVQHLRRRDVYVLPARLAEPISQVDVLHVHEVALVEAADLIEGGAAQQQAGSRQPADRTFAGLEPVLPVGGRPRVGPPQRTDHRVHAAADQAGQVPRRRVDRAVRVADQRAERCGPRPAARRLEQRVDAAGAPLHVGVGDDEQVRGPTRSPCEARRPRGSPRCRSRGSRRCAAAGCWGIARGPPRGCRRSSRCRP